MTAASTVPSAERRPTASPTPHSKGAGLAASSAAHRNWLDAATNVCGSFCVQDTGRLQRNRARCAREGGHREPIALEMSSAHGQVVGYLGGVSDVTVARVTGGNDPRPYELTVLTASAAPDVSGREACMSVRFDQQSNTFTLSGPTRQVLKVHKRPTKHYQNPTGSNKP